MDISPTTFLKQAITTAEQFGFRHAEEHAAHPECKECNKANHSATIQDRRNDNLHGLLTNGAKTFCDLKLNGRSGPVFFYTTEQVPRSQEAALAFHIFNVPQSIAESILIQVTKSIAEDLGYTEQTIRINSLGDKESSQRYIKELTNFLRKRIDVMPEAARELMKDHALSALAHLIDTEHELGMRFPSSLEYLSDQSRKHFREIVEYLDMAELPYEIDPKLLGHHECYSDALFTIDIPTVDAQTYAPLTIQGGRYSEYINRMTDVDTTASGAVIVLRDKKAPIRTPKAKPFQSSVYVVHLGAGPKMQSLILVDQLRRAGISVHHDLSNDSLSAQLRDAEHRGVPYVIIIGQKEFVEQQVILRDMTARSQEQIDVPSLITKLRRSSRVPTAA